MNAQKAFSVGGFYELKNSGREVYDFNVGWRYHKGDVQNAEKIDFDDSKWDIVSTPHTVELMPAEASGGKNYQGVVWYRKHFNIDQKFTGKRLFVHIEAIMGKSKIYVNGELVKEQFGGYLPVAVELTDLGVKAGEKCVIAVMADNSNDRTYAPGKSQRTLDFTYHGGMYRDVWLIATSPIHITDVNMADKAAGGGVFVHYNSISKKQADVGVDTDVANTTSKQQMVKVETAILDADGKVVGKTSSNATLKAGESKQVKQKIVIKNPKLWHPDKPYLYNIQSKIAQGKNVVDGVVTRVGIRKVEFKGVDGFYLNDEYFDDKLMGGNRHQDYAYVGNALPNSKQWQDAKKLRDAGMRVVRVAHYPQDPSF
ncbi:MAG: glycoside hydrolase family 2, partial [Prevotellaceae bacterium]|nr:glycoside hydrolase family 2 [Prevotellaceae bacterium]